MKMDDVEIRSALEDVFEHQDLVRQLIHTVFVHAQRTPAPRYEPGFGDRVPTCKERHLMSLANQFLREIRYHPLCSPI